MKHIARDIEYENLVLVEIRRLVEGRLLSERDVLRLSAAVSSQSKMNLLNFADDESLRHWIQYCHRVELDEFFDNPERDAWRKIWKVLWEKLVRIVKNGKLPKKGLRRVVQCDLEGREIAEFPTIRAAAAALGVHPEHISMHLSGKVGRVKGWRFKYK